MYISQWPTQSPGSQQAATHNIHQKTVSVHWQILPRVGWGILPRVGWGILPRVGWGILPRVGWGILPRVGWGILPRVGWGILPRVGWGIYPEWDGEFYPEWDGEWAAKDIPANNHHYIIPGAAGLAWRKMTQAVPLYIRTIARRSRNRKSFPLHLKYH